jgi:tocopherol O-methyltransferase
VISSRDEIAPEAVASHYDELDHFYRDVWGEHVHHGLWLRGNERRDEAVLQLVELVASQAQIGPGTRACDIGCGYGATARVLAARGVEVTAITISPAQFAIATRHGADGNPTFVVGDWLTNELPSESFDVAYAIESSEHMPDKLMFFSQAHRVLRRADGWSSARGLQPTIPVPPLSDGCSSQSAAKAACRISAALATTKGWRRMRASRSKTSKI